MSIPITSKSYPYLALAQVWDLPYWVVLNYDAVGVWGEQARGWLDERFVYPDKVSFDNLYTEVKRAAITKEPTPG